MKSIEWRDYYIWINLASYNIIDLQNNKLIADIESAIQDETISYNRLKTCVIVLTTLHEGHGGKEYALALSNLQNQSWYDENNLLWINNVVEASSYNHISLPFQMTNHCGFLDFTNNLNYDWTLPRRKLFACLMRRPSPSRAKIYQYILETYHPNNYTMSFCSMPMFSKSWKFSDESPEYQRLLFAGPAGPIGQHEIDSPLVFNCLVNCIVETSNQLDAQNMPVYDTIFITEKTFKAFAWRQIPLWFAVPGTVQVLRDAGFDLFDDLIDHSYDTIQDPDDRFNEVFNQLQRLSHLNLESVSVNLQSRFELNFKNLLSLNQKSAHDFQTALDQIEKFSKNKKIGG